MRTVGTTSASGAITGEVPAGATGKVRVAAYDTEGTLFGWKVVRVG